MLALTTEAQQRPGGGGRPGGGPGGFGGGDREAIGEFFRAMRGGGDGTPQERMAEAGRRMGMTVNEAPTMRMSMFDVVERIGGDRAESILVGQLKNTLRGSEIIHLDGNLGRIAGDEYVEEVLAAAKAVLAEPALDTGMRVDARGVDLLWGLLLKYNDDSFVDFARTMLVDENGRLHRQSNDYLRRFLKGDIMQVYQQIYSDPDLDESARTSIRQEAMRSMGENQAANAIVMARFTQSMNELANPPAQPAEGEQGDRRRGGSDPRRTARYYLDSLAQPRDPSPENLAARKTLLGSMRATTNDTEMVAMMDKVDERLTALADPEKRKSLGRFSLGGGGERRGFGGQRPGGGGQRPGSGGGKKQ